MPPDTAANPQRQAQEHHTRAASSKAVITPTLHQDQQAVGDPTSCTQQECSHTSVQIHNHERTESSVGASRLVTNQEAAYCRHKMLIEPEGCHTTCLKRKLS